jgi:general stress protein 26
MSASDKMRIVKIMRDNCLHAYLATSDGDQPYVRPVSPIVEDNMNIWVTTFNTSKKVKHIRDNPKICLAFVEQPSGNKAAFVYGNAHIVPDTEKKKRVWNLAPFNLSEHFPQGPENKEFTLLKITPDTIEWRDNWETGNKTYKPT